MNYDPALFIVGVSFKPRLSDLENMMMCDENTSLPPDNVIDVVPVMEDGVEIYVVRDPWLDVEPDFAVS